MTTRNYMILFGWQGLLLCSVLVALFIFDSVVLFAVSLVVLFIMLRFLPREVFQVISSGGMSLIIKDKEKEE